MADFRAHEGGKILVGLLLVINLILIAVIVFLLGRPSLKDLRPVSGKVDYLLAVNEEQKPVIYSPDGTPWEFCREGQCKETVTDINCDIEGVSGFVLAELNSANIQAPVRASSTIEKLLISSANAADPVSDSKCPIIGYKVFQGTLVRQYPSTASDPDCPPN